MDDRKNDLDGGNKLANGCNVKVCIPKDAQGKFECIEGQYVRLLPSKSIDQAHFYVLGL